MNNFTPKQRMLNAYKGVENDKIPCAPEFWYYYPAKILRVNMIEFEREVPFHLALKTTFEKYKCEGWGATFPSIPNDNVKITSNEKWINDNQLQVNYIIKTSSGNLTGANRYDKFEPSSVLERPIKDYKKDIKAFLSFSLPDLTNINLTPMIKAWDDVGESYLLEAWLGVPFFDFYAGSREGAPTTAIYDFYEYENELFEIQEKYIEYMVNLTDIICVNTPFESLAIGNSWSNNSVLGPKLWRKWDKPVIKAICEVIHKYNKLLHIHFHGKCIETISDFTEIGIDCVCPFERPPGGDINGLNGLKKIVKLLDNRVTFNGNIHTVETLIRGKKYDVRNEVQEIWEAFKDSNRLIIGTGDQVGCETPEENIYAMIDEVYKLK